MGALDWRQLSGLQGLNVDQGKIDFLWQYVATKVPATAVDEVARFCLAIIPQEGTGSFDTSSTNKAADGGNGYEADWAVDVRRAVDLVVGKLSLYKQACEQGFVALAKRVVSPTNGACDGGPDQWVNWSTAVVRGNGNIESGACYAQHASWWAGVRAHYLRWGGNMLALTQACYLLDRDAPGAKFAMEYIEGKTWLASNWNATTSEPAVIVTAATIVQREVPTVQTTKYPPIKVALPTGRVIYGEVREGNRTWVETALGWVPLRSAAELLGATVTYIDDVQGVVVTLPQTCNCCEGEK